MKASILSIALIIVGCSGGIFCQDVTVTAKVTTPDDSVTQQYMALDQECRSALACPLM
jgi:hypothetical protein